MKTANKDTKVGPKKSKDEIEYKVTYRCDQEEYFCTDSFIIKASSLLAAAQKADAELEETLKATVWAIERI